MVTIEQVEPGATWSLRRSVLRPHERLADIARSDAGTPPPICLGALGEHDRVIGSLLVEQAPLPDQLEGILGSERQSWRIRGVAVTPTSRGLGIGSALLDQGLAVIAENGGGPTWCNARIRARRLYARAGFEVLGEPFELPSIGTHLLMWRLVEQHS